MILKPDTNQTDNLIDRFRLTCINLKRGLELPIVKFSQILKSLFLMC
jgi:hypothetical protein